MAVKTRVMVGGEVGVVVGVAVTGRACDLKSRLWALFRVFLLLPQP